MSALAQELRAAAADWWPTNWEMASRLHATALEIEAAERIADQSFIAHPHIAARGDRSPPQRSAAKP